MPTLNLGDLSITSSAFDHGGRIPDRHAYANDNVSPELSWSAVPAGTAELVLVCHDPDAPLTDGFTHWVLTGIDPASSGLQEGTDAGVSGTSSFGEEGYGGPAPPPGHGAHHYFFHLYALDQPSGVGPGADRDAVMSAIDGHIIEQARVVGTFST
ncbi:MAG: YbhB/YbcL family Raf kinase inhibitor-like protein [Microthrixaceae bacterium]